MPPQWTTAQILALAPDDASRKAGKDLATPRKWVILGQNESAVWGECLGSGSKPYQTQIDLSEPALKCNCPSRKSPCKHGLGLFLLLAEQPAIFTQKAPPEWVEKWLKSRQRSAEKKAKQPDVSQEAPDAETLAKRAERKAKTAADRADKVTAGMQELELWMRDLVRQGLATAQSQPYSFWDGIAARMWDAQAPTVGEQLRQMAGIPNSGTGWPEKLLERLARLYLLVEGFKRLESLPPSTQGDIRLAIGWTQKKEELLSSGETLRDRWLVLWQGVEEVEGRQNLKSQRIWLWGRESGRAALILDFAYGRADFENTCVPGTCIDAELVFYPSGYPLRALIKTRHAAPETLDVLPGYETVGSAIAAYASAIAKNPWLDWFPMVLSAAVPGNERGWVLRDPAGDLLPLAPYFNQGWQLVAASGGHAIAVFGEWNSDYFLPRSAWANGQFIRF